MAFWVFDVCLVYDLLTCLLWIVLNCLFGGLYFGWGFSVGGVAVTGWFCCFVVFRSVGIVLRLIVDSWTYFGFWYFRIY